MGVCMEQPRLQQLAQGALDANIHEIYDVQSSGRHGRLIGELDAFNPLHAEHAAGCVRPLDLGGPDAGHAPVEFLQVQAANSA